MAQADSHSTSRRKFIELATTALVATQADVASAAAPSHATGAAAHPDAELLVLGDELREKWVVERFATNGPDAEFEAAFDATGMVVDRIAIMRAVTIAGLQVKLLAYRWCRGDENLFDGPECAVSEDASTDLQVLSSLLLDLEGMAEAGR